MIFCRPCPRLQLQSPGHYSPLEAFYEDKRAILPPGGDCIVTACPASAWGAAINHSMHPEMKVGGFFLSWFQLHQLVSLTQVCLTLYDSITLCVWISVDQITHPAGCMSQFIRFFGEQIMVLWKLALLRRRILIFSPPPVGVVCYRGERRGCILKIKGIVWHFGNYTYFLSCLEWDEKIDTTLMSVRSCEGGDRG